MVISKYIQSPTSIRFRVKIRNRSLLTATVCPFCCTSITCCSTRCTMRFTTGSNIFWTSSLYCKDQSSSELVRHRIYETYLFMKWKPSSTFVVSSSGTPGTYTSYTPSVSVVLPNVNLTFSSQVRIISCFERG
jgi:hypothetical protein